VVGGGASHPTNMVLTLGMWYFLSQFLRPVRLMNFFIQASTLDSNLPILVFEALKRWRVNKTANLITTSQIEHQDFIYVLTQGWVVE